MGNERDARLLDGIVTTAFEGRDEDDAGVGRQNEFGVEVSLHTYLLYASVMDALQDVLVIEVLSARDTFYIIVRTKNREVRELQRRHRDGTAYGHLNALVALGHCSLATPWH